MSSRKRHPDQEVFEVPKHTGGLPSINFHPFQTLDYREGNLGLRLTDAPVAYSKDGCIDDRMLSRYYFNAIMVKAYDSVSRNEKRNVIASGLWLGGCGYTEHEIKFVELCVRPTIKYRNDFHAMHGYRVQYGKQGALLNESIKSRRLSLALKR